MAATTSQGGSCLRVGSFDLFLLHDDAGGATTEKSFCRGRIQAMEDLRRSEAASTWQLFSAPRQQAAASTGLRLGPQWVPPELLERGMVVLQLGMLQNSRAVALAHLFLVVYALSCG